MHTGDRLQDRQRRALVADGDNLARLLVSRHLISEGFTISECGDGREALDHIRESRFDLIVLDATLSSLDGIALSRAIRQGPTNSHAAVFIIATSDLESDKVLAFANGADDYVTKPLKVREFVARVNAVMRRAQRVPHQSTPSSIDRGEISLDPAKRQVLVRGRGVACSKQEFNVLYALASSPGIVFSREQLLARYWPTPADSPFPPSREALRRTRRRDNPGAAIRLVDPIVSRLRRKIERNPDTPRIIVTVWGIGYKFAE